MFQGELPTTIGNLKELGAYVLLVQSTKIDPFNTYLQLTGFNDWVNRNSLYLQQCVFGNASFGDRESSTSAFFGVQQPLRRANH